MSLGFGHNSYVSAAEESTFGTYQTSGHKMHEMFEESIVASQPLNPISILRGVTAFANISGKSTVSGSVKLPVLITGTEIWIKHAMGALNTSGAGPYTHAFTVEDALPTGLSIQTVRDNTALGVNAPTRYAGCQINRLTLTQEMEQPLTAEIEIIGTSEAAAAGLLDTFPALSPFDYTHFALTWNAVARTVRRFEITIENNLNEDGYNLGSATRARLGRNERRKVSGTIELDYDATVLDQDRMNRTARALVATWTSGANSLTVTLPAATLIGDTPTVSDQGPLIATYNFDAYAASAGTDEITIDLINATASPI